jgi:acetyl-CoA synthetase
MAEPRATPELAAAGSGAAAFLAARDFLLAQREDLAAACAGFRWPVLDRFNWALDYFDVMASGNVRTALWLVDDDGGETRISFAEMARRSNRAANFLRGVGWRRGDRVLAMLPNVSALWEITLAALKLGAVLSPATTLLPAADLEDRLERGGILHVVTDPAGVEKFQGMRGSFTRVVVGGEAPGWQCYPAANAPGLANPADPAGNPADIFVADGPTRASDPLLLYFTSGTMAKAKMVLHTHESYPVGHLSTMYWIGLRPHDVHLNISSPGWAKHAWSSFFAPWNAGATIFIPPQGRFDARKTLDVVARCGVSTLCAPPTVWRMLVLEDLASYPVQLRELTSAGEPLNPEVIARVRAAWGLTIRDGYGQTETTCQIGNSPGQQVKLGSMGRPLPGYRIALLPPEAAETSEASVSLETPALPETPEIPEISEIPEIQETPETPETRTIPETPETPETDEGEIAIDLATRPAALMAGYLDSPERSAALLGGAWYRTSDTAMRDADGYYWYVGRSDDVFKSSDYRISPFELESALIEHPAVVEAAVVPSPDPVRLSVPKAFVVLTPGTPATRATAAAIFAFSRRRLAPYARIRRLEFAELPKTISGKIRRVQLRAMEEERLATGVRGEHEHWEDDFAP